MHDCTNFCSALSVNFFCSVNSHMQILCVKLTIKFAEACSKFFSIVILLLCKDIENDHDGTIMLHNFAD